MSTATTTDRLAVKTPEAAFLQVLQEEFQFSPRVSQALLSVAQEMLVGGVAAATVRPGQIRLVVASLKAPFGPPLAAADKVEVTLTVDAGLDDVAVKVREGAEGLRQGRILRVTEEALEQGGVLTHEDLARALGVDVRTIRRDTRVLKAAGHAVQTRGPLKGVGRGQTHKVRILELWLGREGYDQLARRMHHSPRAIQRYVETFLHLVRLYQDGLPVEELAFAARSSERLVRDYLAVYEAALAKPAWREKLEEEVARVRARRAAPGTGKKGAVGP